MNLKKLTAALGLAVGLGLAGPAWSGSLYFFEDDDLEWVLRPDNGGGYTQITSGDLQENDVLFSVFEIPTFEINDTPAIPPGMELTGISAIQVTDVSGTNYTFGEWGDLNAFTGLNLPDGTAVAMWLNDLTTDVDLVGADSNQLSCTTLAACIGQVSDGTLFQADGFAGDPDEFWTGLSTTNDLGEIKGAAQTTPFVIFNAGLSNLFNLYGPVGYIDPDDGSECAGNVDNCVQLLVSGTVYGAAGLGDTNIVGTSDFQARKYVPEPATLALFGAGLLGLGMRRRTSA